MQHNRIVWDPKIMSGKPVIKGTRIPVATILRWLGNGVSQDELLGEYPTLAKEDIHAAQAFAAELVASEHVVQTAAE